MGTLSTVGILSDGSLGTGVKNSYKNDVSSTLFNGFSIGSTTLQPGSYTLEGLEAGTTDSIKEKYPAWYGYYIDGLLQNVAQTLDKIPDTGILSPVGIKDPTKPIVVVISELSELLGQLGEQAVAVLLTQLDVVISSASEIQSAIESKDVDGFFSALKETVVNAFESAGVSSASIISSLEENKSTIEEKARQLMFIDDEGNPVAIPEVSVEVPALSIPSLDTSFLSPDLNTSPLFYTVEAQGADGLATKFAKTMAAFVSVPAAITKEMYDVIFGIVEYDKASATIQKLVSAIRKILTNVTEAIQEILDAMLGFVWDKISTAIGLASTAFLEISSVINIVIYFVKFFVVSLIGFLIGGGLISYTAAQFLGIL